MFAVVVKAHVIT